MNKTGHTSYDLEKRTINFSKNLIEFCRNVKSGPITNPLLNQLIRSGTSIGANYQEANGASSKKDFKNKIYICKKESQETKYWLHLISEVVPEQKDTIRDLWDESNQLSMIFGKIVATISKSV